jgi:V-type H+-transporting ATPase subunit a
MSCLSLPVSLCLSLPLSIFSSLYLSGDISSQLGLTNDNQEVILSYKKRLRDILQWEKHLADFESKMAKYCIEIPTVFTDEKRHQDKDVLNGIHDYLQPLMDELTSHETFQARTQQAIGEHREHSLVLTHCRNQLGDLITRESDQKLDLELGTNVGSTSQNRSESQNASSSLFHEYICGLIPVTRQQDFERMLFRGTRGNAVPSFITLDDPVWDPETGEEVYKSVFYIAFVSGGNVRQKVVKIAQLMQAHIYEVSQSTDVIERQLGTAETRIAELRETSTKTDAAVRDVLRSVAGSADQGRSDLRDWQFALQTEQSIIEILKRSHFYSGSHNGLHALEGWCPVHEIERLRGMLDPLSRQGYRVAFERNPSNPWGDAPTSPPTYFRTNKFVSTFQGIVDTYGVPRYLEVNPGLFTIITFPFLFGVMYGDMAHGFALTMFALYLVLSEQKLMVQHRRKQLGDIFSMMFSGRYLLLLMGMFAVYCGSIYNDMASIPVNLFGSAWQQTAADQAIPYSEDQGVYPYGVDPSWYNSNNELTFFNSLKMKMSVTIGVSHMTFGLMLSLANHLYRSDTLSIITEFIPQLVFLMSTFGYMIFMIVYKFCVDWQTVGTGAAPNLIQTMITMFLTPGVVKDSDKLYEGQAGIQLTLVMLAAISVPVMLVAKPLILHRRHQSHGRRRGSDGVAYAPVAGAESDEEDFSVHDLKLNPDNPADALVDGADSDDANVERRSGAPKPHELGDSHDGELSDLMIHQAIHTIEYVLGTVSNTASYLRLWALSLAHAELSQVFWEKLIMEYGIKTGSPVFAVIGVAAWTGATFAVLLTMDVLECFLHALRLHWVEFQNKFYAADGYAFDPFSFEAIRERFQ